MMRVILSILVLLASSSNAFSFFSTPGTTTTTTQRRVPLTRLFISSWGTKGSPYAGGGTGTLDNVNPEENVQAYLEEPSAVEARNNVDGTVLVSGCVNDKDRTDQFLFDLLNDEESAFEFTKIVAYVNDAKFSKKRLLSRSARYTGLLDKLDFLEGTGLPSAQDLTGVKSWLAVVDSSAGPLDQLRQIALTASQASSTLENVAVLLVGATEVDATASQQVLDQFPHAFNPEMPESKEEGEGEEEEEPEPVVPPTTFTIVAVGELDEDTPEGQCYYQYESFGTPEGVIPADAVFPRQESYRLITELLQLACGRQRALSFAQVYNTNTTQARLIKGLREAGYARPQEIDHMVRRGVDEYVAFVDEWKNRNPDWDKGYTTDAWWEADIYQQSRRKSAERDAEKDQAIVDERTEQVQAIAKEWVKREYFRQSMAGTLGETVTEQDFMESVWERAMLEADLKFRQMKGEDVASSPEDELADFKTRQERKKQTMLKRAKEELAELLDEDPDKLIPPESTDDDDDDEKKK